MKENFCFLLVGVTFLALMVTDTPLFAAAPINPEALYRLTELIIKAKQIGLSIDVQEKSFWEGVDAYAQGDNSRARDLFVSVSGDLSRQVNEKRQSYRRITKSASDVEPESLDDGAVYIWTLLSSEAGDFERFKAVRNVAIAPNSKWAPAQENVEKAFYVVSGKGKVTINKETAELFPSDLIAVPANMNFTIENTDAEAPLRLSLNESYPHAKVGGTAKPRAGEESEKGFLEIKTKRGATESEARAVLAEAAAGVKTAEEMGIRPLYQAEICFDIAKKCLQGGNYDGAYTFAHIANDWMKNYIEKLEEKKALYAANGIRVANRMQTEAAEAREIPPVEPIAIKLSGIHVKVPVLSVSLLIIAAVTLPSILARRRLVFLCVPALLIVGALALFPVGRADIRNPFASEPVPEAEEASSILVRLLTNTYRAFLFKDEDKIYDYLAISVTGDQLANVYLQNRRVLQVREANSETLWVDDVEVTRVNSLSRGKDGGFAIHAQWRVAGAVRHWGHEHYRRNLYEAIVTIVPVEAAWKIRHLEIIEEKRLT
jgi:mannose-6-phosphate isomerase-like protein (cupin superfamily)